MTFPNDQLDLHLQIFLRSQWVEMAAFATIVEDIYQDTYVDTYGGRLIWHANRLLAQSLTINQGRADETSDTQPSSVSFRLINDDGQLTPDDPRSQWWPDVAKGAPVRIKIADTVIFSGEIANIVPSWPAGDISHVGNVYDLPNEADPGLTYVDIDAAGILRRLGQGQRPLRSPIERLATSRFNLQHVSDYWPFEDGTNATMFASALGGTSASTTGITFASDSTLPGADPVASVSSGQAGVWGAPVVGVDGSWCLDMFLRIPEAPATDLSSVVLEVYTTGTHARWRIDIAWDADEPFVWIRSFSATGVTLVEEFVPSPLHLFGGFVQLRLRIRTGNDWSVVWSQVTDHVDEGIGDVLTGTGGRPNLIRCTVRDAPPKGVSFGHVIFRDNVLPTNWLVPADIGWAGESALTRISRLCSEENVAFQWTGDPAGDSALLGVQHSATLLDLLREAAAADDGILCEGRTFLGLVYRTGRSRYNRPVALTLDAGGLSQVANPFAPTADDQTIRNTITVERINGAKATAVDTASAAQPPVGDGVYEENVSLSLFKDAQVHDQAGWHLHRRTWSSKTKDLPSGARLRYPKVTIDIAIADSAAMSDVLATAWLAQRVGHRVAILNSPPQHPVEGPVDLTIEGWSETVSPYGWVVTLNCSPAGPSQVATWLESRWCAKGRTLQAAIDGTQTTFDVTTNGGVPWTVDPARFPMQVRVGGTELVMVASIGAPSGGAQTFTVTRDVNHFGRTHPAGATVNVWPESVLAL